MPELFEKRIRIMKFGAYFDICSIVLALLFGLLTVVACYKTGFNITVCILGGSTISCIIVMIVKNRLYLQQTKKQDAYHLDLNAVDVNSVVRQLSAVAVDTNAFFTFSRVGRFDGRVLIQHTPSFDQAKLSTQRKRVNGVINKKYGLRSNLPMYKSLKKLRINLVICNEASPLLVQWVCKNTELLLSRNESIINGAVVVEQRQLILPGCIYELSLIEVNKYEQALRYLVQKIYEPGKDTMNFQNKNAQLSE